MSRTVLGERFVELLGEPPMRYCARWRMRTAANMLRDGSIHRQHRLCGRFNSEAAFNRAFKREYGEPPATWRKRIETEEQARIKVEPRDLPPRCPLLRRARRDAPRLFGHGIGPPLVKTANWLNHIEHDWNSPLWRHWLEELT